VVNDDEIAFINLPKENARRPEWSGQHHSKLEEVYVRCWPLYSLQKWAHDDEVERTRATFVERREPNSKPNELYPIVEMKWSVQEKHTDSVHHQTVFVTQATPRKIQNFEDEKKTRTQVSLGGASSGGIGS